ncbi:MAG TPA: hypothetical protein VJI98_03595 [Candidatus Nanoarchaeia archaeon]|nr:hypothetical protein [Candidatus Nanoarchaeia archaeon]
MVDWKTSAAIGGNVVGLAAMLAFGQDTNGEYGFISGVMDHVTLMPNLMVSLADDLRSSWAMDGNGILSEPRGASYALGFSTVGMYLNITANLGMALLLSTPFINYRNNNR